MPITVICTGCKAKLGAPDTAAGQRVKCPKCKAMIAVPGNDFDVVEDDFEVVDDDFEVVEEAPVKPKAKPKPALKRDDDDDDEPVRPKKRRVVEDEDDDDLPRKKSKKAPKSSNLPLIIGGVIALVAVLGVGGFFLFGSKKKSDPAKIEWTTFTSPDGTFTAQFPGGAPNTGNAVELIRGNKPAKPDEQAQMDAMKAMGMSLDGWVREESGRKYYVVQFKLPPALAAMMKPDDIAKQMTGKAKKDIEPGEKIFAEKTVTLAGQSTVQFFVGPTSSEKPHQTAAFLVAKGAIIIIAMEDKKGFAETDEMMLAFFNRLTINAGR